MNKYTVIGVWSDQSQPWMEHVLAGSPNEAVYVAICNLAVSRYGDTDMNARDAVAETSVDLSIVEVIKGHHKGILGSYETESGEDFNIDMIPEDDMPTYLGLNKYLDAIIEEWIKPCLKDTGEK